MQKTTWSRLTEGEVAGFFPRDGPGPLLQIQKAKVFFDGSQPSSRGFCPAIWDRELNDLTNLSLNDYVGNVSKPAPFA
jgi:hypothetical protein